MEEVIIKGTKYISSKRAAKASGYAKDYIGQLVRKGKLNALKVGRGWFVDENQLLSFGSSSQVSRHNFQVQTHDDRVRITAGGVGAIAQLEARVQFPKTWSEVKYESDPEPLYPNLSSRESVISFSENQSIQGSTSLMIGSYAQPKRAVQYVRQGDGRYAAGFDGVRLVDVRNSYKDAPASESLAVYQSPMALNVSDANRSLASELLRTLAAALLVAAATFFIPLLS